MWKCELGLGIWAADGILLSCRSEVFFAIGVEHDRSQVRINVLNLGKLHLALDIYCERKCHCKNKIMPILKRRALLDKNFAAISS